MLKLIIAATLMTVTLHASTALAQFHIDWYTIDGGGGTSTGGGFSLSGTIGQPDAGTAAGGAFQCNGGFWPGVGSCPADWSGDGLVNSNDISAFLTSWLNSVQGGGLAADFNGDMVVNSNDISAFLTAWLAAVQGGC